MTIEEPKARNRRKRPAAPTTPDPVEIAMEAEASGKAPTSEASALLRRQSRLIDEQIGLARNERFRNRIKAVRDMGIAFAVLLLAGGVFMFVWNARQATGLVIQPLSMPPDLALRGLDSKAVAAQLLDRLNKLQADTQSARAAGTYANDWRGDVSVEIASTGVSISELDRWLRASLGSETLISGEVTRTGQSLSMTVRTDSSGSRTIASEAGDLDILLQGSAEAIYESTQPYRYGVYLLNGGRRPEGLAVLTRLAVDGSRLDRAWANLALGTALGDDGDLRGALDYQRRALTIQPDLAQAHANLAAYYDFRGEYQRAHDARKRVITGFAGPARHYLDETAVDAVLIRSQATQADYLGDHVQAAALFASLVGRKEYSGEVSTAPLQQARTLSAAHDVIGAGRALTEAGVESAGEVYALSVANEALLVPTADMLMERRMWPEALAELEAYDALAVSPLFIAQKPVVIWPRMAEVLARLGRFEEAGAILARTPSANCYPCLMARGRVAAIEGDRRNADLWFDRAARAGPSLPQAEAAWGQARLASGEVDSAIALFRLAAAKGPRWADPLKYWGDALAAKHDYRAAISKYRAAADRAPRWGALRLAWGRALEATGRRDEARAKYRAAAGMDLSAADRAEVVRRLAAP